MMDGTLLADIVDASARVAATRSRLAKVEILAEVLGRAVPAELEVVTVYLAGGLRQRRTGLGWRSTREAPPAADAPSLAVLDVDDVFNAMSGLSGPGSRSARGHRRRPLRRATLVEQRWLVGAITGNVRQGASDALVQEAVARLTGIPVAAVRSAAMLAGSTRAVVGIAVAAGEEGLAAVGLEVGRPVLPMLAASEPGPAAAWDRIGAEEVAVEWKLDGIRIQVHKRRRPGAAGDPDARRHHRPGPRDRRGRPGAARRASSCSTARRSRSARTGDRGRSRRPRPRTASAPQRRSP